jgi:hypothetical protein
VSLHLPQRQGINTREFSSSTRSWRPCSRPACRWSSRSTC